MTDVTPAKPIDAFFLIFFVSSFFLAKYLQQQGVWKIQLAFADFQWFNRQ